LASVDLYPNNPEMEEALPGSLLIEPHPNNPEMEEALLGSLLINPAALDTIAALVPTPQVFYQEKWGWVYKAMLNLKQHGAAIDVMTVGSELEKKGTLKRLGSVGTLVDLISKTPTSVHAESYAREIRNLYDKRRIIAACQTIVENAYEKDVSATDAYMKATDLLAKAEPTGKSIQVVGGDTLDIDMLRALKELNEEYQEGGLDIGWPWPSMRKYLRAWRKGQPAILIAEGGAGKTAFCMEIAGFNAQNGGCIFYAHTEDEPKILLTRRLSTISGIPYSQLESGNFEGMQIMTTSIYGEEFTFPTKVFSTISSVGKWTGKLYFIDVSGMTVPEAIYELKRMENEVGTPDAVIYDWFFDHKMRPGPESIVIKLTLDQQDLKQYSSGRTRLMIAMQTGKSGAGKRLGAYDAFWSSSPAHYGKTVLTLKRERELVNGDAIGPFKPEIEVTIAKSNLDQTGTFKLAMKGETFYIYEPKTMQLPESVWD